MNVFAICFSFSHWSVLYIHKHWPEHLNCSTTRQQTAKRESSSFNLSVDGTLSPKLWIFFSFFIFKQLFYFFYFNLLKKNLSQVLYARYFFICFLLFYCEGPKVTLNVMERMLLLCVKVSWL